MTEEELKLRTKKYTLRVVKLVRALPQTNEGRIIGSQLLRSGISVGANYRAACRARSRAEFVAKIGVVIEEVDECAFWLEIVVEAGLIKEFLVGSLLKETDEILSIMVASSKSAGKNRR